MGRVHPGVATLQGISHPLTFAKGTPFFSLQESLAECLAQAPHWSLVAVPVLPLCLECNSPEGKAALFLQALAETAVLADSRPPSSCQQNDICFVDTLGSLGGRLAWVQSSPFF